MTGFQKRLSEAAGAVDGRLNALLAAASAGIPARLLAATAHGVLGGGKRFRPFLVLETAALFGLPAEHGIDTAAAVECIHCYSLVHDDLPAMDNDALRRGRPTVWKEYDEWTAILVGDLLQALAFEILSHPRCHPDAGVRSDLVATLAKASGGAGMVGGQALDLEASRIGPERAYTIQDVLRLQAMKTGRLITASCEMGAILGGASQAEREALRRYGDALGYAFQLSDDLLDAEGGAEHVGKATGKDAAAGKATLVSLMGIDAARAKLCDLVAQAEAALEPFAVRAATLAAAARFMLDRDR